MNGLKSRGCQDVLIAVVDGLKGFPEAKPRSFRRRSSRPASFTLIRYSLEFVSYKDRKPVVPALRAIYRAKDAEAGIKALEASKPDTGARNIRRSPKAGGATGSTSIPFLRLSRGRTPYHLHDG